MWIVSFRKRLHERRVYSNHNNHIVTLHRVQLLYWWRHLMSGIFFTAQKQYIFLSVWNNFSKSAFVFWFGYFLYHGVYLSPLLCPQTSPQRRRRLLKFPWLWNTPLVRKAILEIGLLMINQSWPQRIEQPTKTTSFQAALAFLKILC